MDPTKLAPGHVVVSADGSTHVGESATRRFQVVAVISALKFEARTGLKITRRGALPVAKQLTGNKTNNRQKQIELLTALKTQLEERITFETRP